MNDCSNIRAQLTPADVDDGLGYNHPFRPQFHYTPKHGYLGDTTGLVCYRGAYHLFYMFDPWAMDKAEHKTWGHATSHDLLYWEQQAPVLDTLVDNRPGSGCGVVDHENTSGLRRGAHKPLVLFYTDYVRGTCILYSADGGESWTRYRRNPVLSQGTDVPALDDVSADFQLSRYAGIERRRVIDRGRDLPRDPLVFRYKPTGAWCMIRHEARGYCFYTSRNLLDWTHTSRLDGFWECPDFFELPVEGADDDRKWVLVQGNGNYLIGSFDGRAFTPETENLTVSFGGGLYATQTWKETQDFDRLTQMAWMPYREPPPGLVWRGQTCIPCSLSLKRFPEGPRLCRNPLVVIKNLYTHSDCSRDVELSPGAEAWIISGDLLDLALKAAMSPGSRLSLDIRGYRLEYDGTVLTFDGIQAPVATEDGSVSLRILMDRCSVEIFARSGSVTLSRAFFPKPETRGVRISATGGRVRIKTLDVHHIESIWLGRE